MTIVGARIEIGAIAPYLLPDAQQPHRDTTTQFTSESQLNTAIDRTGLEQAITHADPWAFDPALAALKTFARMNPDRAFEAYDLEEHFGIHFDHPARWGALFQTARKAGYIEPVGFTQSRRPARAGGVTRVWMAVHEVADQ